MLLEKNKWKVCEALARMNQNGLIVKRKEFVIKFLEAVCIVARTVAMGRKKRRSLTCFGFIFGIGCKDGALIKPTSLAWEREWAFEVTYKGIGFSAGIVRAKSRIVCGLTEKIDTAASAGSCIYRFRWSVVWRPGCAVVFFVCCVGRESDWI